MLRRWSFFRAIYTRFRPWQNIECDHNNNNNNNNNHPHTWHGERIAWIGNINQSDARLKRRTTSTVELHQTWCEKGVRIEEHNHLRRRNYSIKTGWLRLRHYLSHTRVTTSIDCLLHSTLNKKETQHKKKRSRVCARWLSVLGVIQIKFKSSWLCRRTTATYVTYVVSAAFERIPNRQNYTHALTQKWIMKTISLSSDEKMIWNDNCFLLLRRRNNSERRVFRILKAKHERWILLIVSHREVTTISRKAGDRVAVGR